MSNSHLSTRLFGLFVLIVAASGLILPGSSRAGETGKNPNVTPADLERTGPPNPAVPEQKAAEKPGEAVQPAPQTASGSAPRGRFSPVLPPANYSPPSISIDATQYNFGTVFRGETVLHEFQIENKGSSQLIVQRVKPSCGCTYVDHTKVVAPGGKGVVSLKIETSRLRPGPQTKTAEVYSNDPTNPKLVVTLQGTVTTPFTVTPEYPRIETVRGAGNPSTTITLTRSSEIPFRLVSAKSATNKIRTEIVELQPEQSYEVKLTADVDSSPASYFYENVTLELEGAGKKLSHEVSVSIRFKDRITANPRTVYFRRNEIQPLHDTGTPVSKSITVKSEVPGTEFKFKITQIEVIGGDDFKTTQSTVKEGEEYKIDVSIEKLPTDSTIRSLKGDVIIHTDDPANPKIPLRVLAFI